MEPFHIDVPDEVLNDLQTRLKLTRWADDFANESWQYGTNAGGTAFLDRRETPKLERLSRRSRDAL